MFYKYLFPISLLIVLGTAPFLADASVLYFDTKNNQYGQGDVFLTEIRIDTKNENINLGEITVNFSPEYLKIINISTGNSVFTLWPKNPVFSNESGTLSFIGGAPGGFGGDGKLLSVYFMALKNGQANVGFGADSVVLLNNGSGSRADLTAKTAAIDIMPAGSETPRNEWETQIKEDDTPPEGFEINISKIEGKYFAIFSTTDAGSGIDRYEIKEGKGEWRTGESPYLLENQSLRNKIFVRAVDKAGNEKLSEILPPKLILFWILESLTVLLILMTLGWLILKRRKKRV